MDKLNYLPVLMADIGGTNSRLRIMQISKVLGEDGIKVDYQRFLSNDFKSLLHLLETYLEPFKGTENYPLFAAIAIPGPVNNNKNSLIANIPSWTHSDGDEIAKALNLKKCILINDFVAVGYGITGNIKCDKDFFNLTSNLPESDGVFAVIGAGTGIGHVLGYKSNHSKYHEIIPSEGGHQSLVTYNEVEWKYRSYIQEKMDLTHISQERAVAGPAIPYMFNFFIDVIGLEPTLVSKSDIEFDKKRWELTPEEIVDAANKESCKVCMEVRKLFVEMTATEAANICILTLPKKGLYLVGNITLSFIDYIKSTKVFWDRFYDKGRVSDFLKTFPIYVVTDTHIGIKGSEEVGRREVEEYLNLKK